MNGRFFFTPSIGIARQMFDRQDDEPVKTNAKKEKTRQESDSGEIDRERKVTH